MMDANYWALLTPVSLLFGGQEKMRSQYRPGVWSQCPGSYWVINFSPWSVTNSRRPDHARLADRDEESSTCTYQGIGQSNASQHGSLIFLKQEDWVRVNPLSREVSVREGLYQRRIDFDHD